MTKAWNEFNAIPNGTRVLNHGWDQCVALANLYNESVVGGSFVPVGSAFQWWTEFDYHATLRDNYTRSAVPVAGAIFVSRYGLYDAPNGHIGVVTGVNSNGTFNTMEQNAGTWRYVGRYTRNYQNMLGFLIPKKNPAAPPKPAHKPAPLYGMEDAMIIFYANAQGKGKPGWLILGYTPNVLLLSTQKAANQWGAKLGNAITTDAGGFEKYLTSAGGTQDQLNRIA